MAPLRPGFNKPVTVVALILTLGGLALFMYALLSTSIGYSGLINHGLLGLGLLCAGVGLLLFSGVLTWDAIKGLATDNEPLSQTALTFTKEVGTLALNIACMGVALLFLAVGLIGLFDHAEDISHVVIYAIISGASVAAGIGFLVWRHRHPHPLPRLGTLAMLLFMCVLGIGFALSGALYASETAHDLASGPRSAACYLSGYEASEPTGRYRALSPTTFNLEFTDEHGQPAQITISEQDRETLGEIITVLEAGYPHILTYYPETRIYVSLENGTATTNNPASGSR